MASSDWNDDFLDLIDALHSAHAELIVGAFALAQHGLPRAKDDLDVLGQPTAGGVGSPLESSAPVPVLVRIIAIAERGCHSEWSSEETLSRRANPNDPKEILRLAARNDT